MSKNFTLKPKDIRDLKLKLEGKLPVDREELLVLVNSWGRNKAFYTNNKELFINICDENEKYDLSKLDVSKITNFDDIFARSNFNGDINSWDVSNATSMEYMFDEVENFNQPLDKWNVSNVTSMDRMFYGAKKFNQDLNSWNISNVINFGLIFANTESFNQPVFWDLSNVKKSYGMFKDANAFENRFNKGKSLPENVNEIREWLEKNRELMEKIEIEDKIDNNRNSLDKLLEEKQIDPKSKLGLELIEIYNETQNKLKLDLDNLKNEVKTLAINDFSLL